MVLPHLRNTLPILGDPQVLRWKWQENCPVLGRFFAILKLADKRADYCEDVAHAA